MWEINIVGKQPLHQIHTLASLFGTTIQATLLGTAVLAISFRNPCTIYWRKKKKLNFKLNSELNSMCAVYWIYFTAIVFNIVCFVLCQVECEKNNDTHNWHTHTSFSRAPEVGSHLSEPWVSITSSLLPLHFCVTPSPSLHLSPGMISFSSLNDLCSCFSLSLIPTTFIR